MEAREYTTAALTGLGFDVLPSCTNFIFAKCDNIDGGELYTALRDRGILVRHFTKARIEQFNRITVGTMEQMQTLVANVKEILEEKQ